MHSQARRMLVGFFLLFLSFNASASLSIGEPQCISFSLSLCWADTHIKITRTTLTIKLDRNRSSFQLANSTPSDPTQPQHREGTFCLQRSHNNSLLAKLPKRVYCPWQCAMPVQHLRISGQAQHDTSPRKNLVTSKSPVGDISVVTLIRTDTTLDHSQKAEKV